jgi:hypothetical protein
MPNGIRFDSHGRIIIEDEELGQRIIDWLQLGKEISLRVPFASGPPSAEVEAFINSTAPVVIQKVPVPIPMLNGCPNSMCDCPVFKIPRPGDGVLGVKPGGLPGGGGMMS